MSRCNLVARLRTVALAASLLTLALVLPRPALALEKVVNGRFDFGIGNWPQIVVGGSLSWDGTLDARGSALSGSYLFENENPLYDPNASSALFVTRCYPVSAGETFFAGATMRFVENEPSKGRAKVLIRIYPTTSCTGTVLAIWGSEQLDAGYGSSGRGVWTHLPVDDPTPEVVVPAGGKSLELALYLGLDAGTSVGVNVDDVYLAPVGTPVCGGLPATIVGTGDPDVINGTTASDVIVGLGGSDQIYGKGGNDVICGNAGKDTLYGAAGDDELYGNGGVDSLFGGPDADLLVGGAAGDMLYGSTGPDVLRGAGGSDTCDGGADADVAKTCETVTAVP